MMYIKTEIYKITGATIRILFHEVNNGSLDWIKGLLNRKSLETWSLPMNWEILGYSEEITAIVLLNNHPVILPSKYLYLCA